MLHKLQLGWANSTHHTTTCCKARGGAFGGTWQMLRVASIAIHAGADKHARGAGGTTHASMKCACGACCRHPLGRTPLKLPSATAQRTRIALNAYTTSVQATPFRVRLRMQDSPNGFPPPRASPGAETGFVFCPPPPQKWPAHRHQVPTTLRPTMRCVPSCAHLAVRLRTRGSLLWRPPAGDPSCEAQLQRPHLS